MYYCVRYILVKKRRGENWLISNYISRKKRKGDTKSVFPPILRIANFLLLFLTRGNSAPTPFSPPNRNVISAFIGLWGTLSSPLALTSTILPLEEESSRVNPPIPCQQPLLCHISLGRFSLPPYTSFPFSQEVGEGERKAMTCEGEEVLGKEGRRKKCGA